MNKLFGNQKGKLGLKQAKKARKVAVAALKQLEIEAKSFPIKYKRKMLSKLKTYSH